MTDNFVFAKKEIAIIRYSFIKIINKIETLFNGTDADILDLQETIEQLHETSIENRM